MSLGFVWQPGQWDKKGETKRGPFNSHAKCAKNKTDCLFPLSFRLSGSDTLCIPLPVLGQPDPPRIASLRIMNSRWPVVHLHISGLSLVIRPRPPPSPCFFFSLFLGKIKERKEGKALPSLLFLSLPLPLFISSPNYSSPLLLVYLT